MATSAQKLNAASVAQEAAVKRPAAGRAATMEKPASVEQARPIAKTASAGKTAAAAMPAAKSTPTGKKKPPAKLVRKTPAQKATRGEQVRAHKTRDAILRAATRVFARNGFTEGKIESISKLSRTHDRMIYYYFGSKAQLFVEVLEATYQRMNDAEAAIHIDLDDPVGALTTVVNFVWQYYLDHPEFITLLNSENLLKGKHIKKSVRASQLSSPAVAILNQVLRSGVEKNLFRQDISARDLYLEIAALGYFYLSNHYTLSAFLNSKLLGEGELEHWRAFIIDVTMRSVRLLPGEPATRITPA